MRFKDDKPYRGQLNTLDEIYNIIAVYGLPQQWNSKGDNGPERYIEVQIWDDGPLNRYLSLSSLNFYRGYSVSLT